MDESTLQLAARYINRARDLREALEISQSATVQIQPLGQGEHNANFSFVHPETGEHLVLRINYVSQLGLDDQIGYEYAALQELAPSGRTPLPLFVDGSRNLIDQGILVMQFRKGGHLDFRCPGSLGSAARILADVHSVVPSEATHLLDPGDALRDLYDEDARLFTAYQASPLCDRSVTRWIAKFFASVEGLVQEAPAEESLHILNTEAVPSHFLIPADGTPGSMVDWEKPIRGEVARDVAYFVAPTTTMWDTDFIFDQAGRAAFVEEYWDAVGGRFPRGSFDERFEAYLKMNCLRGVTWSALAWTEYADPCRPLQNEKTRRKLSIYLSEDYLSMLARTIFHCS